MPYSLPAALDTMWRLARRLPPLPVWRLAHTVPAGLVEAAARLAGRSEPGCAASFLGYRLASPLGLAAGFDKDGRLAWLAWSLGMGFHVVGSVLPRPHAGVEPKILLRLPGGVTINRLGLPSPGARRVARNLSRRPPGMPLAVSIAGFTVRDYISVARALEPYADWFEVNISCPNVEEHRSFEEPDTAAELAKSLAKATSKPLLLKIPPTTNPDTLLAYADIVSSHGLAGVVAANTLQVRINGTPAGLGGTPLYRLVHRMVRVLREALPSSRVVVAVGGVDSTAKALKLLREGASLVELLSPIVHRGPLHVARMAKSLECTAP